MSRELPEAVGERKTRGRMWCRRGVECGVSVVCVASRVSRPAALSSECRKSGVNILTARSANFNKQLSLIIILLMRCNALFSALSWQPPPSASSPPPIVNKQTIYVQTMKRSHASQIVCHSGAKQPADISATSLSIWSIILRGIYCFKFEPKVACSFELFILDPEDDIIINEEKPLNFLSWSISNKTICLNLL